MAAMELPTAQTPDLPSSRIVDFDIYALPGDPLDAWLDLQTTSQHAVVWSPRNGGHWIALRGQDIAAIYADHERFSSEITIVPRKWGELFPLRPTTIDPPEHRRFRRVMNAALQTAFVSKAQPAIEAHIHSLVAAIAPEGHCDFVRDIAARIPLYTFMHLANLPLQLADELPRYAEDPNASTEPVMDRYANFLKPLLAERYARPTEDLLGRLADESLAFDEAVDVATAVLTGGLDTVTSAMGMILCFLARSPEHRRQLSANPAITQAAVAELLRRFPIMTKGRLVRSSVTVDEVQMAAGDMVVLPPLHGLDPQQFEDPLFIRFDRETQQNVAFGNGVHRCPGEQLTVLQLGSLLRIWLQHIPHFELNPDCPPLMRSGIMNAMLSLPLRWQTG